MNVIAKHGTKRQLETQATTVGPWLAAGLARFPFLEAIDLVGIAAEAAVLDVPTGGAVTSTLGPGRHTSSEISAASKRSALRAEGRRGKGASVELCTADAVGRESSDWRLAATVDGARATVEVAAWRTREDKIPNVGLLGAARDALLGRLAHGVAIDLIAGMPDVDALVTPAVLEKSWGSSTSPFEHDRLIDPPQWLCTGTPMEMPVGSMAALTAQFQRRGARGWEGQLTLGMPASEGTAIELIRPPGKVQLRATMPANQSRFGQQRSFRWVVSTLHRISVDLGDDPAARAVGHYVGHAVQASSSDEARWSAAPAWSRDVPCPAIKAPPVAPWPIAVRVVGHLPGAGALLMARASNRTLIYERRWTRGLSQAKRQANAVFTARRFAVANGDDGQAQSWGRFTQISDNDPRQPIRAAQARSWWWECGVSRRTLDDGRGEIVLNVRGLSHTAGMMAYGLEQLAMLRGFVDEARAADPDAHVETLCLDRTRT